MFLKTEKCRSVPFTYYPNIKEHLRNTGLDMQTPETPVKSQEH